VGASVPAESSAVELSGEISGDAPVLPAASPHPASVASAIEAVSAAVMMLFPNLVIFLIMFSSL
jgi:hypothetical protein